MLRHCCVTIGFDLLLWVSMLNRIRSKCIRWRLGWLPGGKPQQCACEYDRLTWSHTIHCLDVHYRLQLPRMVDDPLSYCLNKIPKRPPKSLRHAWGMATMAAKDLSHISGAGTRFLLSSHWTISWFLRQQSFPPMALVFIATSLSLIFAFISILPYLSFIFLFKLAHIRSFLGHLTVRFCKGDLICGFCAHRLWIYFILLFIIKLAFFLCEFLDQNLHRKLGKGWVFRYIYYYT